MKKLVNVAVALLLTVFLYSCTNEEEQKTMITISAAVSLQAVLMDVKERYEDIHPETKIVYNFGSSGTLQKQIVQGAPVDLFISAAEATFEQLLAEDIINEEYSANLLSNGLVVIVPNNNDVTISSIEDLTNARTIAIGTPESVPAGQYAVEALTNLQLWEALQSKAVYTKDVRQVLTYTESANVDAGIVYKTDARTSSDVTVIATIPMETHTPIIYPVGIINDRPYIQNTQKFYEYLFTTEVMEIFESYGFKGVE